MFGCGWDLSAHALYVPQPDSYLVLPRGSKLAYLNEHDPQGLVVIEYNTSTYLYRGLKYFAAEKLGEAVGHDWQNFFIHLTALGCDRREVVTR